MAESRPVLLTNTMGHRLEEFQPISPPRVLMYTCGPTVYNHQHIGNFRSFLMADILRRVLEYNGYEVLQARNITDVGHLTDDTLSVGLDKIEAAARKANATPRDIANHYIALFVRDAARLNLKPPDFSPRATEYVEPMIELTHLLVDSGYAYPANGNVYYDVTRFPSYGRLSGNSVEDLVAGARVEVGEGKRSPADFALWRGSGQDKIMRWPSPWGEGVPGWHIECSAMSMALLGEEIDIHTGGVDNIFPHHEDEIAQSEAATGKRFVRYWLHSAWLVFSDEKMSKSLGNIYTISDLIERGIHPLAYRYFTFQAHYRTPLNFSWEALEAAHTALTRIWEGVAELVQSARPGVLGEAAEEHRQRFHTAINHDLDMPRAVAVVHDVLGSKKLGQDQKLALLSDFDRVLGLDLLATGQKLSETTTRQRELLEERARARADKDWVRSDELRASLADQGLDVKDTAGGQRWVRRDLLTSVSGEPEDGSTDDANQ